MFQRQLLFVCSLFAIAFFLFAGLAQARWLGTTLTEEEREWLLEQD